MAVPVDTWTYTPNKVDHLTRGFTSKVLFNYQYTSPVDQGVFVNSGDEVFSEIQQTFGKNYKGTNVLKGGYFAGDDGRTFRITMYFEFEMDGSAINLNQRLYDVSNNVAYDIPFKNNPAVSSDGGYTFVKYECYLSYFQDSVPDSIIQGIGSMVYAANSDNSTVYMPFMYSYATLTNGTSPEYKIQIKNTGFSKIYPASLMIEEIS